MRGEEAALGWAMMESLSSLSSVAGIVSSRAVWMTTRLATTGVDMRGRGGERGARHRRQEKEEDCRTASRWVKKPAQEVECTRPPHCAHSIVPLRPSDLPQMTHEGKEEEEEEEGGE